MEDRLVQSVWRALDVLEMFDSSTYELSIKEISGRMGLSKSTVHSFVRTLTVRGYLEQNPENQKYKLGLRLLTLGSTVQHSLDLRKLAYPAIKELSSQVRETVHLVLWNGMEAVYIDKIEGPTALSMSSQVGRAAKLHCTGVGKVILAFLEEPVREAILSKAEFTKLTVHTIADPESMRSELQRVVGQGYAMDDEEIEIGLKCIAAPIFNHSGSVIGSISCSGPKQRMDERETQLIQHLQEATNQISSRMGHVSNAS